jgi:hypothetical protein
MKEKCETHKNKRMETLGVYPNHVLRGRKWIRKRLEKTCGKTRAQAEQKSGLQGL